MKWATFVGFLLAALVFDGSLAHALAIRGVAPSATVVVVVFAGMFAPPAQARRGAWIAGLLVDLAIDLPHADGSVGPMIGPNALGFAFGAELVLALRAMLMRRRALAIGAATLLFGLGAGLVAVFLLAAHGWYDPVPVAWTAGRPLAELVEWAWAAGASALLALLLAPVLLRLLPLWSFRGAAGRGPGR